MVYWFMIYSLIEQTFNDEKVLKNLNKKTKK
jgi:hypothetical protein